MTEHPSPNQDPVSQAALHLLNKADADPTSEYLYVLQLMLWGIETAKVEIGPELAWELDSVIGADLLPEKPEKVLAWLMYPEGSREPPRLDPEWLRAMSPGAASRELLNLLRDRLIATSDWEPGNPLRSFSV